MRYLRKQADLHPDVVTLTKEGTTEEGRDIMLIKISDNSRADTAGCRAIWIDSGLMDTPHTKKLVYDININCDCIAGIHAREWIATAAGFYVVDRLIKAFSSPVNRLLNADVRDVDWFIMPLLNPDGYEYSRTTDRMWRKNRSKPKNRKDGKNANY